MLETREATFSYDDEGNLVQKIEKNGDTWKYEYYGNGMMSRVIKPDNTEVTFKYDSLGRRIVKCSEDKATSFVWDGNTTLHEYFLQNDSDKFENLKECSSQSKSEIPDDLVTWVFNDGFVPSVKITSEGNYSIISDYLGTPLEAYDGEGKKVWSAELDIYGRVMEFTGEQDFIPFRYQGQFEDNETGLYYNRFRYYSPSEGMYLQQDPIGLAGGNPTLYGYVYDPLTEFDLVGFKPTKYGDRLYLKELLGPFAKKGGVYFFPEGNEMYVGKAKNLYKRLYQHLNKGKLDPAVLDKVGFIHDPNALTDKDLFKLEDDLIEKYKSKNYNPNKINSPGKNIKKSTKCKP